MQYFRIIFKTDDGNCVFTDVIDDTMSDEEFQKISWDKPIIRHVDNGHVHFISLERHYLDAMRLGIHTFLDLNKA